MPVDHLLLESRRGLRAHEILDDRQGLDGRQALLLALPGRLQDSLRGLGADGGGDGKEKRGGDQRGGEA